MNPTDNILVVGSGVAGLEASLMLSKAGKKVYLVEKLPLIGGKTIKNEETYPNMECSTCLVAPIQQDILQDPSIDVMTLSTVEKIEGKSGNFKVKVRKKARYVDLAACLGCGMCYPPCPVSLSNEWEENLIEKKAIYVPCAGSLPNVPTIDPEQCLQLNGKEECNKCVEACMFAAINLNDKDQDVDLNVGAIMIATGYDTFDASKLTELGYGKYPNVYSAMEFERLFASNGPTEGKLTLREEDRSPESVAIIHCIGRDEVGYCSNVCCMSSSKHARYLRHKLPDAKIYNIYSDICLPDKTYQKFHDNIKIEDSEFIFQADRSKLKISEKDNKLDLKYINAQNEEKSITVDMIILANALIPPQDTDHVKEIFGVDTDEYGFISSRVFDIGSVRTSRSGNFKVKVLISLIRKTDIGIDIIYFGIREFMS